MQQGPLAEMGFINFNAQIRVALDETGPLSDRRWALWSCCCSVASLTGVIAPDELVRGIASRCLADVEAVGGKSLITSRVTESARFLLRLRAALLLRKREHDEVRKDLKRANHRFPVVAPFSKNDVLNLIALS